MSRISLVLSFVALSLSAACAGFHPRPAAPRPESVSHERVLLRAEIAAHDVRTAYEAVASPGVPDVVARRGGDDGAARRVRRWHARQPGTAPVHPRRERARDPTAAGARGHVQVRGRQPGSGAGRQDRGAGLSRCVTSPRDGGATGRRRASSQRSRWPSRPPAAAPRSAPGGSASSGRWSCRRSPARWLERQHMAFTALRRSARAARRRRRRRLPGPGLAVTGARSAHGLLRWHYRG